jgi:hypothetical protein
MSQFEYLVTYGQGAHLGRFGSSASYRRDDRVVVRSARGMEAGVVLDRATSEAMAPAGEILRPATADDEAAAARHRERVAAILSDAESDCASRGLPLLFLDGEILLDGSQAILQAVHWADCDATPLFEALTSRHRLPVKLADLTAGPAPASTGCPTCGAEKSGCDSCGSGGGCSTGSCSRGSVKTAHELTDYFAGLRRQMEAVAGRVSLH